MPNINREYTADSASEIERTFVLCYDNRTLYFVVLTINCMTLPAQAEQLQAKASDSASRKRTRQGEETRRLILRAAVNMASKEGLEALTIGKLASELEMSKSGLFAHFNSKEDLQLSTFTEACAIFNEEVLIPALKVERGAKRLWKLCKVWLKYGDRNFGGCFFTNIVAEYHGRPGPIRNVVAKTMRDWQHSIERLIRGAQQTGELRADCDAEQLAFELNALFFGASLAFQLNLDQATGKRMKTAVRNRLLSVASDPAQLEALLH